MADEKKIGGISEEEFDKLFAKAIENGQVRKEVDVMDGMRVEFKSLDSNELMDAESLAIALNPNIPIDVVQKARMVSVLAEATTRFNGVNLERDDTKERREIVSGLRKKYAKLTPTIIDRMYDFYRKLELKQNSLFENHDRIENF